MFMTAQEVADLTGYQKPSKQIAWLTAERFGFVVGGDGHPKVLRDVVLSRLGAVRSSKKEPQITAAQEAGVPVYRPRPSGQL